MKAKAKRRAERWAEPALLAYGLVVSVLDGTLSGLPLQVFDFLERAWKLAEIAEAEGAPDRHVDPLRFDCLRALLDVCVPLLRAAAERARSAEGRAQLFRALDVALARAHEWQQTGELVNYMALLSRGDTCRAMAEASGETLRPIVRS